MLASGHGALKAHVRLGVPPQHCLLQSGQDVEVSCEAPFVALRCFLRTAHDGAKLQKRSKGSNISDARAAVARIALVKPDKARGVENMILQAAQRGNISEKVRLSVLRPRLSGSAVDARSDCGPRPAQGRHLMWSPDLRKCPRCRSLSSSWWTCWGGSTSQRQARRRSQCTDEELSTMTDGVWSASVKPLQHVLEVQRGWGWGPIFHSDC